MIPKGFFLRILWSTLIVVLIFSIVTGGALTILMRRYMMANEEKTMLQTASELSDLTVFLLENESASAFELYQRSLNSYSYRSESTVFVADREGRVMFSAGENGRPKVGTRLELPSVEGYKRNEFVRNWSTLNGLYPEKRLNLFLPLVIRGQFGGTLVMSSPLPQIAGLMSDVFHILLVSLLLSFVVAVLLATIFSRRLSRPVLQLKRAAQEFAQGNFDVRVSDCSGGEFHELSEAFNEMAASLDQLEQNRRSFVANVSHELRSPLTTINGFLRGMTDGTIPPDKRADYMKIVLDEVERMTRMVNDLLYTERKGKEPLRKTVFDLNELIRLVLIGYETKITEKRLSVNVEFSHDSQSVFADRDEIRRVITNLIDNAVKFVPDEGELFVSAAEEAAGVTVRIGNSGDPIPSDVREHIFDRFYKADLSRGINKNGMGLGLHIVKTILARHGCSIRTESTETLGAIFVFTLPKRK